MNKNDLEETLKLAREGDEESEQELFKNLTARFLLFARRKVREESDAREIVQEAVMAIAKEYRSTEFTSGFVPWAYKVFENRLLTFYRNRQRQARNLEKISAEAIRSESAVYRIEPELKIRLSDCLKKIIAVNPRYARILNLHHQGFDTDEIRGRMDLTSTNLYSILSRARSLLEHCLKTGDIK